MPKVAERLAVLDRLAGELASRYDFNDISTYVEAFGLSSPRGYNSDFEGEKDYAKQALRGASIDILGEMINDLGIEALSNITARSQPPAIWASTNNLKVFISHTSKEKQKATRLRSVLARYGMNAFVAHEDIEPSLDWQVQIERALHAMELFISLHTAEFSKSFWTQQEIGFAVARGVKIIAVRMDEDPTGFLSKYQALPRGDKTADQLATDIDRLVKQDERLKKRYEDAFLDDDVPF